MFQLNVMKTLTAPFLGVLGQTLLVTVQLKVKNSGGPAIIFVAQETIALPFTEIKWHQTKVAHV